MCGKTKNIPDNKYIEDSSTIPQGTFDKKKEL